MKKRNKTIVYDWASRNQSVHAAISGAPAGIKHIKGHHLMSVFWFCAGITMAALAMLEVATGFMYHTIIRAASDQLADFFGLDGATISGLASRALIQGKNILAGMEVAISLIFFTGFYYCRRLIARSHYIKKLEKAAERETANLFREKEFEYEAAE